MFGRRKENILVVKTDSLAGFVAAEPFFDAIRAQHPNAAISLLTSPSLQRLARAAPHFDQVASLPNLRDPAARKAFVRQLKTAKFSRVYDLSADDKSKRIQSALGAFGPKWFAAGSPAKPGRRNENAARLPRLDKLSASAGLDGSDRRPDFSWAVAARKDSANMRPDWFGISGPFGLLMPGMDETRRWPAASYGEFCRHIASEGVMPVLVGGKDLHAFGDEICEIAPECVDLTGKTDHLQLAALAREAAFFVSDCAEEVQLATAAGAAGVIIRKSADTSPGPEGRHVISLTVKERLDEVDAGFVWRALTNMGLAPSGSPRAAAAIR